MKFIINGIPKAQKQTRFRKVGNIVMTYDPSDKEKKAIQNEIYAQFASPTLTDEIHMDIDFFLPIPKSTSKKKAKLMNDCIIGHIKKPDIDNLAYLVTNALKKIVYRDDSQIVSLHLTKCYSENPRTEIEIRS